ncbi:MAG: acetolactate synthase small subunit [Epulopiscium sp.]|jgi:acetolactate synthase-1/3 small subunit|nr:acetolactate synthase small subunit [Candidatus Epulonipiscium sp.]
MKKYIISILVQNNFGVLARVSNLFARRCYNIHSLTVSPTNDPTVSKITVVVMGDDQIAERVLKQVSKLEETIEVMQMEEDEALCKELVLVKILTPSSETCSQVSKIVEDFHAKMLRVATDYMTVELTDVPSKVESFVEELNQFQIKDMCCTGVTALESK